MSRGSGSRRFNHVAVLMGGLSAEREVSLNSGKACAAALESAGYKVTPIDAGRDLAQRLQHVKPDVCFNALHGRWGEDGCVQGLLELLGIPYTGADMLGMSLDTNKFFIKEVLQRNGVPVPMFQLFTAADDYLDRTASPQELLARVRLALRLKETEERCDRMAGHLLTTNQQLEEKAQFVLASKIFGLVGIAASLLLIPIMGVLGAVVGGGSAIVMKNLFIWWFVRDLARWTNAWRFAMRAALIWGAFALVVLLQQRWVGGNAILELATGLVIWSAFFLLQIRAAASPDERRIVGSLFSGRERKLLQLLGVA